MGGARPGEGRGRSTSDGRDGALLLQQRQIRLDEQNEACCGSDQTGCGRRFQGLLPFETEFVRRREHRREVCLAAGAESENRRQRRPSSARLLSREGNPDGPDAEAEQAPWPEFGLHAAPAPDEGEADGARGAGGRKRAIKPHLERTKAAERAAAQRQGG